MTRPPCFTRHLRALVVVAVCLAAGHLHAGTARLAALGGGGDYLGDERNALRWYASAGDHAGLVVIDPGRIDLADDQPWSGRNDGPFAGIHVQPGSPAWGTFVLYVHADAPPSSPGQVDDDYPGGAFSLVWGRAFGRIELGAGFRGTSYSDFGASATSAFTGREEFRHDLGLGLRSDLGRGVTLEVAGELRQVISRTVDPARGLEEIDGGSFDSYGLRTRMRIPAGERTELIPLLDYTRGRHPVYSRELDDHADLNGWLWRAGFAVRTVPRPESIMVFSAEGRDGRDNHDGAGGLGAAWSAYRFDWWSVLVRMGFEARLLPWLAARASVQYHRVDQVTARYDLTGQADPAFGANGQVRVAAPLGLGVAVHLGGLRLDLTYNDHAPLSLGAVPTAASPLEEARYVTVNLVYAF